MLDAANAIFSTGTLRHRASWLRSLADRFSGRGWDQFDREDLADTVHLISEGGNK